MTSIRTLLLELVDEQGASHIRELHIEILRGKPATPEHTIRARLSEAVADDEVGLGGRQFLFRACGSFALALLPGDPLNGRGQQA